MMGIQTPGKENCAHLPSLQHGGHALGLVLARAVPPRQRGRVHAQLADDGPRVLHAKSGLHHAPLSVMSGTARAQLACHRMHTMHRANLGPR